MSKHIHAYLFLEQMLAATVDATHTEYIAQKINPIHYSRNQTLVLFIYISHLNK